jgi:hypothetical protein
MFRMFTVHSGKISLFVKQLYRYFTSLKYDTIHPNIDLIFLSASVLYEEFEILPAINYHI